jgi:hypothetical protein
MNEAECPESVVVVALVPGAEVVGDVAVDTAEAVADALLCCDRFGPGAEPLELQPDTARPVKAMSATAERANMERS